MDLGAAELVPFPKPGRRRHPLGQSAAEAAGQVMLRNAVPAALHLQLPRRRQMVGIGSGLGAGSVDRWRR